MTTDSDTFRTLAAPSEGLYKEKGSRFMAYAYPVVSVEDVKPLVDALRKRYHDARHHCFAYVIGETTRESRQNDDGEPSGTAGRPIHGQILSLDLTNTLVVVVRYFGGVLLGASGLANAYKLAARDALNNAQIEVRTIDDRFRLTFDYLALNDVMKVIKDFDLKPQKQTFDLECSIELRVRQSQSSRFLSTIHGLRKVNVEKLPL
ncbi:MAG: YigZ family protein [Bacteroidales bacterium]|nr:YigZ family protein [Bacteroidales bacterium]